MYAHIPSADFLRLYVETCMGHGEFLRMYALILLSDCVRSFAVQDFLHAYIGLFNGRVVCVHNKGTFARAIFLCQIWLVNEKICSCKLKHVTKSH